MIKKHITAITSNSIKKLKQNNLYNDFCYLVLNNKFINKKMKNYSTKENIDYDFWEE